MAFNSFLRRFRALALGGAVAFGFAGACAPDIHFVKPAPGHCSNGVADPDLGESDIDCGGGECDGCDLGKACAFTTDCAKGQCLIGFCQQPGCDNQVQDSDETGIDCGGSCKPCLEGDPCLEGKDCATKSCQEGHCAAATCDDTILNGDETARDCGGSTCDGCPVGSHCLVATDCISASCDDTTQKCLLSCMKGTDECDNDLSVECETNLLTSARNCGKCGNVCDLPHADASCIGGSCQIEKCVAPWDRCDADDTNGCETNLSNDAANCGACGMECPAVRGTPKCVNSKCTIACDDGFKDCDSDSSNGCETSVSTDVENCGGCGTKCPAKDPETPFCNQGDCGVSICDPGTGNCAGDPSGECANDLTSDPYNCGHCGRVCAVAHGTSSCVKGECVVAGCDGSWDNCNSGDPDGGYSDGCESNTSESADNCGSCGNACDVKNGTGVCQSGSCAVASCKAGFKDCDAASSGGLKNGCETDTTSDAANCGGCGNQCSGAHANMKCVDSACALDTCASGYGDCTAADGCETDISTSIQHCGSCTGTCSKAGATSASCAAGKCQPPVCDSTHLNCDGDNSNGCEATLGTAATCNACPQDGGACASATPNCVATAGTNQCQAQITLANSIQGQAAASSLTLTHTPTAGSNRIVLIAVASESQGNGVAGAQPDSVTYGGTALSTTPAATQAGANDYWSPDLFIYVVPESVIGSKTSASVVINGGTAPTVTGIVANVIQLNGVRQTSPITPIAGATLGTPDPPDPSNIATTVAIGTTGARIYSFTSEMWWTGNMNCPVGSWTAGCPSLTLNPSTGLTATSTFSTQDLTVGGQAPMRAFGALVTAASAAAPVAGNYSLTWSIPFSARLTALSVVVNPAQQ